MFDLFRRRDTTVRYVLMGLLGLVALSMVVTLIPGFGTGMGSSQSDQLIAEVAGEPVNFREAATRIEGAVRRTGMPRNTAYALANNVLDDLITQKAVEYEAKRLGFSVTDEDLGTAIRAMFPTLFPNGKFMGREAYASILAQQNLSIAEFEASMRSQLLVQKIASLIGEGIIVTPSEIEAEYKKNNEKIKIEFVKLTQAAMAKNLTVSDADVRAEYDRKKATLKVPEKRAVTLLLVDEARVAAGLQANEADLRRAYEDQKDRFRTAERVNSRHILIKTTEKPESEIPKLQAKAEALLKQLQGGADFAELAKKNSEDPGSAAKGGELGFLVKGQTVKNFEEALFTLKPKELSKVVKTEYGFHIIQVLAREDARLQPFEEVRGVLQAETQRQLIYERMQRNIDALRAGVIKSPGDLEKLAQQYNAAALRMPLAGQAESVFPGVGPNPDFAAQIFGLRKGESTSVIQGQGNTLAIAVLNDIQPERPSTFEEAQAKLKADLLNARAATLLTERSLALAAKARSGADLKKLAAEFGGEYKTAPEFARNGAAEGIGSAGIMSSIFGKPVGTVSDPFGFGQDRYVARVTEVIPADLGKLAQERDGVAGAIKEERGRERSALFTDGLVQKLTKDGKIKINDANRKRLLNQFGAA